MGKIFCLMGKSSVGKDSVFKGLIANKELKLMPVTPYTTRPKRVNEKNGVDYYFIDEQKLEQLECAGKMIEKRCYHTVNGNWYYCTIDDGQIDIRKGNYLLIVTLEAYISLQRFFGAEHVVPVYIAVDDGIRMERALSREKKQLNPNYDELCRRFLADNADFSQDKLNAHHIVKWYFNNNLKECIRCIQADIMRMILLEQKHHRINCDKNG